MVLDKLEKLADQEWVKSISFGEKVAPALDYARPASNVSSVQEGFENNGKTVSFDGSGVVCGMMDTGFDANHCNFVNSDGSSRIKRLWHMNSNNGSSIAYTDATVKNFSTDNSSESHATHVAGIIGGSYKGNGTYRYVSSATGTSVSEMTNAPIPYYGVATGADFACAVGSLYTPNIVQGVTNIIEYAESEGKPVVVNLSLGSTSGPHDGSDAYSQALSALGQRGIICMSAGNDGDANMSLTQAFTSRLTNVKTTLENNTARGICDIWSSDNQPLKVTWGVYNTETLEVTDLISITAANQSGSTSGMSDFTTYFNGTITVQSTLDPNNNRFEVYTELNNVSPKTNVGGRFISLVVEGVNGQTAYIYGGTNVTFSKNNLTGYSNGSPANSINDAVCGDNIISVGSYNSRTTWGTFSSNGAYYYPSGSALGAISTFSSYGTSFQGKKLPLITGPGSAIISSFSSYYVSSQNESTAMTARADVNGQVNYWGQMQGTSMSCPYVSGTIGLWLQADPTLNFSRIMDVINKTSTTDAQTMQNSARWGAGKIDALKGIQQVLADRAAGIGNVWADDDQQRLIVTPLGGALEVFLAGGQQLTATLYDLQGRPVATASADADLVTIPTASLSRGIYILEARTPGARLTQKLTL